MTVSAVIILAAGKSKRMKTGKSKVLHPLLGRPMILYGVELAQKLKPQKIIVVVGKNSAELREAVEVCRQECLRHGLGHKVEFAVQREPRGTGDAARAALPRLKGMKGTALIFYADTPLLQARTLKKVIRLCEQTRARLALLTAIFPEPPAFGRIIRDGRCQVRGIIEDADCTLKQKAVKEVNAGVYCADIEFLKSALLQIRNRNRQKEYYLTDLVKLSVDRGLPVVAATAQDFREALGVNSRSELAQAASILQEKINSAWMTNGVSLEDPCSIIIEPEVRIGRDTLIEAGARLSGRTRVGKNCRVQAGARIIDSTLADNVEVRQGSVIEESRIGSGTSIGPMAHLRPGSKVGRNVRIGNFVELKKARVGDYTMAAHLTYLGDAIIGRRVNIGCGVISCNFDGVKKNTTIIEDDAFIGSDSQLVAPVRVGKGAYIGSGSTITEDVPPGYLAISRGRQVTKPRPRLPGLKKGKKP